jgi:hypothetical protein
MTSLSPGIPSTLAAALIAGLTVLSAAVPALALPPEPQAREQEHHQLRMERLLQRLDRNGDGRVDRQEASVNRYLERHFDRLDDDGKGYLVPADLR